jgi:nicotinate phosphoribosyltransferase
MAVTKNVVLVIDMLRGFLEPPNPLYCGDAARRIIPNIQRLLEREFAQGSRILYLCDSHVSFDVLRIALVDTFKDEPEESIIVAQAMGGRLQGVRLDTPAERGGVTVDLVKETRARLDLAGFQDVKVFVSGGIDPDRIRRFLECGAPVDAFGVGSYISGARPIDFTADLHEVEGKPVAKRGRIPGITANPRLRRVM